MHRFFRKKTMKWFHSYLTKQLFHFIRKCISGSRGDKLRSSSRIYVRIFNGLLYINDIPQALANSRTYLHADDTSIFYQHKRRYGNRKRMCACVRMCANGLLIISGQFISVKIKLNAFFTMGKKLPELNRTYDSNIDS